MSLKYVPNSQFTEHQLTTLTILTGWMGTPVWKLARSVIEYETSSMRFHLQEKLELIHPR